MEMVHGLPGTGATVDHEAIPTCAKTQPAGHPGRCAHDRGPNRKVFDIIGGLHVLPRYHKKMHRRPGVDIAYYHDIGIAINDIRLLEPFDDPTERAVTVHKINSLSIRTATDTPEPLTERDTAIPGSELYHTNP
jgi:hypothetical protein